MKKTMVSKSLKKDKKQAVMTINTSSLEQGMQFDAPVFFNDNSLFVAAWLPIKNKDISKLKKMGILKVYTRGNLVAKDGSFIQQKGKAEASFIQPGKKNLLKLYNTVLMKLNKVFDGIKGQKSIDTLEIDRIINDLFLAVKSNDNQMMQLILNIANSGDDIVVSAINSTIITIVISLNLKLTSHRILQPSQADRHIHTSCPHRYTRPSM